jgi:hypothetical protein
VWPAKAKCILAYVEYKPNTNTNINIIQILWTTGHGKRRKLRSWIWLICFLHKKEYRNLKPTETTIRKGLRQNEEN